MRSSLKIQNSKRKIIKIWAWSCAHLKADLAHGRNSITKAFNQIEGEDGFEYDFSINAGDFDSNQTPPDLENEIQEGEDIVNAFKASSKPRGVHYTIAGNHDAGSGQTDWFLRYIDPLGENTEYSEVNSADAPYKINLMKEGSWHSYYFKFDKYMFVMLSDRNEIKYPYGRENTPETGGHPSGTLTLETWEWFKALVLNNTDKNIFVLTHMNPRNTTLGTPDYDGVNSDLHGSSGIPAGSGSIYSIYDEDTQTSIDGTDIILDFLEDNPQHTIISWMAGHSHAYLDEVYNGRSAVYVNHNVTFLNIGNLTNYHTGGSRPNPDPDSRLLTLDGRNFTVETWLHEIANGNPIGFYHPNKLEIPLKV